MSVVAVARLRYPRPVTFNVRGIPEYYQLNAEITYSRTVHFSTQYAYPEVGDIVHTRIDAFLTELSAPDVLRRGRAAKAQAWWAHCLLYDELSGVLLPVELQLPRPAVFCPPTYRDESRRCTWIQEQRNSWYIRRRFFSSKGLTEAAKLAEKAGLLHEALDLADQWPITHGNLADITQFFQGLSGLGT